MELWLTPTGAIFARYAPFREGFYRNDFLLTCLIYFFSIALIVMIEQEVKPKLDRIVSILHEHAALIELPPKAFLLKTFPAATWSAASANEFLVNTIGYAHAWDRILAQWDVGRLDQLAPPNHMFPWYGLMATMTWSLQRGEEYQQELIGMTDFVADASSSRMAAMEGIAARGSVATSNPLRMAGSDIETAT